MSLELVQFAFSHYNEKARWALDYKGLAHRRRSLLPGPHVPVVKLLTGKAET
ncbi:MAG: glutathione S-transferase N-terminal domain-containing protein, partial [Myxococcales bacterium]|nr:glutathione S-transferase N-terminal domain-containing protein [Myxococcales bacterium]